MNVEQLNGWRGPAVIVVCILLGLVILLGGRGRASVHTASRISPAPSFSSSKPAACLETSETENLQSAIDAAPAESALCLASGVYSGRVVIAKSLTIWGPRSAVIQSAGQGSTLSVTGNDVQLQGFTIRGSGNRFDLNDSALKVNAGHVLIQDLRLEGALFGLTAERASHIIFRDNEVTGDSSRPLGLRGDAVRLWETKDSAIEQNRITDCRDIVIWYSSRNRISGNLIYGGRYGTHFMYSDHQEVLGNKYIRNVVGIFAMYTHAVTIRNNLVQEASQADGMGIGVKDSDGLLVEKNLLIRDNAGVYLDASPASAKVLNCFRRNVVALNNTGVIFHASESNTIFNHNTFSANRAVTSVEGNGDALAVQWTGNYFDDYQGYDLNHDGFGDVPYELRSFSTELIDHYPTLAFFRGSPAMGLMEFFSKVFPYLQPKLILRDTSPRMNRGDDSGAQA